MAKSELKKTRGAVMVVPSEEAATGEVVNLDESGTPRPEHQQVLYAVVPIAQVYVNPWNPNQMDAETFNRLSRELQENGCVDPIQVVPAPETYARIVNGVLPEDGRYMILGGEHRWTAGQAVGWKTIPVMVLLSPRMQEEKQQRFLTTKLNAIRGKVNPEKFMRMYRHALETERKEELADAFGFTNEDEFKKLIGETKAGLKASGAPKEVIDHFDAAAKEVRTIEDMSTVLNRLFTEYGDTLRWNFMVFSHGGQDHLFVTADRELWKLLQTVLDTTRKAQVDLNVVLREALADFAALPCLKGKVVEEAPAPPLD
jgi:ParB-like chromosome segregation protein Spo0J